MNIKEFEDFKKDCENKRCNRNTFYNEKTCLTKGKQETCYKKYLIKLEKDKEKSILQQQKKSEKQKEELIKKKDEWEEKKEKYFSGEIDTLYDASEIDEKEFELKKVIWKRDADLDYNGVSFKNNWQDYCVFWNYIFTENEKLYILKNHYNNLWLNKTLDLVHIESRANRLDLKYDPLNCCLGGRYFHSCLDGYRDLVTGQSMNNEQREKWIDKLKNYIKSEVLKI